jgi:glucose 1-dehydrogenase
LGTKWEGVSVWLARLLTHPVKGLDNYEEMIRLLTEEKSAIKVFIER